MTNNIEILKELIIIALPVSIIHLLLFHLPVMNGKDAGFYYSILLLYFIFFILSLVVLITVSKISEKNFDNTGMVFMIATSVKMVIAFFLARPILHLQDNKIEKINFFAVFIIFLLIETIIVAKILNKK
ncbi:MAG TPA: hypothetical protein VK164_10145 [Flavobacterium sp.]|uniref:hypothetical protein n=1 Tax=Flavobacterium sp. TaxID=239 RepID=UPI002B4AC8A3|nr:hypothetical protein [Flavobacterium sp.]HLO74284.1 hypothetical protein [Flavobacterium sp.]